MSKNEERVPIKKLDDGFLSCREQGHVWAEIPPDEWGPEIRPAPFGWLRIHECIRCSGIRRIIIDHYGEVASRSYYYPVGFKVKDYTPSKAPLRKEAARRRGIQLSRLKRRKV